MSSDEVISVACDIERDDLNCMICQETVTTPLIHCMNGYHFCCLQCVSQYKKNCPQCRSGKMFHNKILERLIKPQMIECIHEGCSKYLFKWATSEHEIECAYKQFKCEYCGESVSMKSLNNHIKNNCTIDWLENSEECEGGTVSFIDYYKRTTRGYCFKLGEIKNSFVMIFRENVMFFSRAETNWEVKLLNHKRASDKIIIKFWHPKLSEKYEMFTTINTTPSFTLEELSKSNLEIPLGAVGLEVETGSNSWTPASILVNRLLESDL